MCDPQRLNSLLKNSRGARQLLSAAEAVAENRAFIAAVNRCATQKQEQSHVFQQTVKPLVWRVLTAWLKPYPFKAVLEQTSRADFVGGLRGRTSWADLMRVSSAY
jgi:hypothetical protein